MSNLDGNHDLVFEGITDLISDFSKIIKEVEKPLEILEIGAKEFTKDLLRLPKPYSKVKKAGYTHLIDTFSYRKTTKDVEVGWGKYYGRMLEDGTSKMKSQPHLKPLWNQNKNKYYEKMIEKTGLK